MGRRLAFRAGLCGQFSFECASTTAISKPSALVVLPAAETICAVPTIGATATTVPLDTVKCHPDLNRRPALSRHEPAGAPTAAKATHRSADDEALAKRVAHNDNSSIDGEWTADSAYCRQNGPTGTVVPT